MVNIQFRAIPFHIDVGLRTAIRSIIRAIGVQSCPHIIMRDPNDSNFRDKKFGFGESLLSDPDLGTRSLMHPHDENLSHHQYNTAAEKDSPSHDLHKLLERSSKLEELKILLNKHCPPKLARKLLHRFIFLLQDANGDKFLEDKLEWLRRVDKSH